MKPVSWPQAFVITIAIAAVTILAAMGADTTPVVGVIVTVIGGLLIGGLQTIKDQTNGAQGRLIDELSAARKEMAEYHREKSEK